MVTTIKNMLSASRADIDKSYGSLGDDRNHEYQTQDIKWNP